MASRIVQRSLSQESFGKFQATWIFVVTWYNVTHSLDSQVLQWHDTINVDYLILTDVFLPWRVYGKQ